MCIKRAFGIQALIIRQTGTGRRLGQRLARFRHVEDGALIIFALVLFILMTMMGGIAVDLMRYEATRTTLQNTLDRSTLAAASLTQTLDPEEVVNDYFVKAGLDQYLTSVTVSEGINFREVEADALANTQPMFLHMMGIQEFEAPGHSMAEQRISNVEIMLVLDVSGSMASNNKLTNLKVAANEFIDTVLSSDADGLISIGIVPFNGQVNLGATLISQYNAPYPTGQADVNCVDLPNSVYNGTGISQSVSLPRTAHADTFSSTSQTTSYVAYTSTSSATVNLANVWCPPQGGNIVRLPSQSISTLQSQINGLYAVGATSINAGFKWGLALLDPSARDMYDDLILAGSIPEALSGRPYEYTDAEAMKVIVLMTDGEHFAEERVNDVYKSGLAPIYRSNNDNNYSVYHASVATASKYWVPHLGTWQAQPWTNSTNTGTSTQLTWPQVWANLRQTYVAWQFYARALGTTSSTRTAAYNTAMADFKDQTATSAMDSQLQGICTMAKDEGVIVYGIAFEAPAGGQTQIRGCSTSTAHYFNASGLQISTAFNAIASNISQLRLTQ
jgi:Flp pilus assembly protein TadG